jgi:anti-sigma B factor antagonist
MFDKVKVHEKDGVTIVAPRGEYVGGKETDALRDTLLGLGEGARNKCVVDLAGTSYVNSTALGVLIAAHSHFATRGGHIALANVNANIRNIFVITKLSLVFQVYDTLDAALVAVNAPK